MIAPLLGGIGLFLLGMVLLTDGLKAVAGEALRRVLTRFVAGPVSGVAWGAAVTALVQSSTATTLATVGFVSAGLLTFTQAVGVIFGANLGTTSTGWIVSQLGFKVSLGTLSPPVVLVGVAMRLMLRGRWSHAGVALAGFGVMFIGIDMLQSGMGAVAGRIVPADLPGGGDGGLVSRVLLAGVGLVMTVVMQSSSASMTVTLSGLASGAITLEQGAAMVVGHCLGTTLTAIIAAIGAPAAAQRTALAHVVFNLITGSVALVALPGMVAACSWLASAMGAGDEPTALAMFHTGYSVMGLTILLPMVGPFSRLIERLVPQRGPEATRYLSAAAAAVGPVALEAARRALATVLTEAARAVMAALGARGRRTASTGEMLGSIREARRFVHRIGQGEQSPAESERMQSLVHAADHLEQLVERLIARPDGLARLDDEPVVEATRLVTGSADTVARAAESVATAAGGAAETLVAAATSAEDASKRMADVRRQGRAELLRRVAAGAADPDSAGDRIDALLVLDALAYHLWRSADHLVEKPVTDRTAGDGGASVKH